MPHPSVTIDNPAKAKCTVMGALAHPPVIRMIERLKTARRPPQACYEALAIIEHLMERKITGRQRIDVDGMEPAALSVLVRLGVLTRKGGAYWTVVPRSSLAIEKDLVGTLARHVGLTESELRRIERMMMEGSDGSTEGVEAIRTFIARMT